MKKKWPAHVLQQFIELYEQHPCLWNRRLASYKNRELHEQALRKIVRGMKDYVPHLDVHLARAKIRSVRNAYVLELHKVLRAEKNGGSPYVPTVPWFNAADRFLRHCVKIKDSDTILTLKGEAGDHSYYDSDIGLELDFAGAENGFLHPSSPSSPMQKDSPAKKKYRKAYFNDGTYHREERHLRTSEARIDGMSSLQTVSGQTFHVFRSFGQTVAAYLHDLPLQISLECQIDIMNYLVGQKRRALQEMEEATSGIVPAEIRESDSETMCKSPNASQDVPET